jgi:uncharacterized protein (DUF3820 family)
MNTYKQNISLDHTPLNFGKYKGKTPDEISEHDPSYIVWMYNNIKPKPCSEWLMEVCKADIAYLEDDDDDYDDLTGLGQDDD